MLLRIWVWNGWKKEKKEEKIIKWLEGGDADVRGSWGDGVRGRATKTCKMSKKNESNDRKIRRVIKRVSGDKIWKKRSLSKGSWKERKKWRKVKTGKRRRRRRGRSIRVESDVVGGGAKRRKGKDKNQIKILETKQKKKMNMPKTEKPFSVSQSAICR